MILILLIVWFILVYEFSVFYLVLGFISVAASKLLFDFYFSRGIKKEFTPKFSLEFLEYFFWIIWQVILANIEIIKYTYKKNPDIDISFMKLDVSGIKPYKITLLANSITLTPGTVTVYCDNNIVSVGMINKSMESGVREIHKKIIAL